MVVVAVVVRPKHPCVVVVVVVVRPKQPCVVVVVVVVRPKHPCVVVVVVVVTGNLVRTCVVVVVVGKNGKLTTLVGRPAMQTNNSDTSAQCCPSCDSPHQQLLIWLLTLQPDHIERVGHRVGSQATPARLACLALVLALAQALHWPAWPWLVQPWS